MKNILWLASWFPNKLEPLSGDFIERHARSVALLNKVTVLFVVKDHLGKTRSKAAIEKKQTDAAHLTSVILYYSPFTRIKLLEQILSGFQYFFHFKKLVKEYIAQNGKPDLINVHICFKAGTLALYCKWRYGIRYVVSEQWTIFCKEAKPGFNEQHFISRWLIRLIYKNATHCSVVSEYLGISLKERFDIKMPVRIPNVVDAKLFFPSINNDAIFRFIHISVLNYQKSPVEIINAVNLLKQKTTRPFEFIIYGPLVPELIHLVDNYQLKQTVQFRGEVMQDVLSAELRNCNALVLYSRFETFGCVIVEAYSSGVPVIVSDIPVMREIVEENNTGVFVVTEDPEKLADKMLWMMENISLFDTNHLATIAKEKYSFEKVSRQFDSFYNLSLQSND